MAALASDLAETFSTSSLKLLNGIQQNLIGSKISKPSTKFVFFGPIGTTRWPPRPLIGRDIFDFSVETAERNSTNLDRKQDLNALYQVCVFSADREKQDGRLASDWLRYFRLFLWNRWMEFNETWQESRSKPPLPSLCFSSDRKNKMAALASDWPRHFSTSPLKPLNQIQWNLIGSKISTPSTKFVFFWADRKNKMSALASDWLRHFRLLCWKPLNGIQQNLTGSKLSMPYTTFVFFRLCCFLVQFWCQIFDAFIVLRWATVAHMGLLLYFTFR